jgi:hypothetical protein
VPARAANRAQALHFVDRLPSSRSDRSHISLVFPRFLPAAFLVNVRSPTSPNGRFRYAIIAVNATYLRRYAGSCGEAPNDTSRGFFFQKLRN